MDAAEIEALEARARELEARMAAVPAEEVERYKALSFEDVSRRAAEIEARLDELARLHGSATAPSNSETDDWLALRREMELEQWPRVGEMAFGRGERWARCLAAHAAAAEPDFGIEPSPLKGAIIRVAPQAAAR